jgi:chemotaxis signal transduction protein
MSTFVQQNEDAFTDETRISVVEIGGYLFGIEILRSKEVFPIPEITPVPNSKKHILGVFNLRGEVFPLVEISPMLGLESKETQLTDMVVLLDKQENSVGILTDRIHGVRAVKNSQIKSARGSISKIMLEFISGMVTDKSEEIYILSVDRILATLASGIYN